MTIIYYLYINFDYSDIFKRTFGLSINSNIGRTSFE